jgi:hypothetical protein
MKMLFVAVVLALTFSSHTLAAEKKAMKDIDTNQFTTDTQVMLQGSGDKHVALAWWIPNEFWQSVLAREKNTTEADKKAILEAMSGTSLLAIVQADITPLGAFKYYSKEEIERKMQISFSDAEGKSYKLKPLQSIDPNLEVVLGMFKPILSSAMGNLGSNMHFYVLNDKSSSARLINPYQKGQLSIQLARKESALMTANIELPLNSLFVPRKCPNGKPAHISWQYCPWNGERLAE